MLGKLPRFWELPHEQFNDAYEGEALNPLILIIQQDIYLKNPTS